MKFQEFSEFFDGITYITQSGNFHFEEDPFSEKAGRVAMIMHEALLKLKFLQTEPQKYEIVLFIYNIIWNLIGEN